jgi:hypothetical protein
MDDDEDILAFDVPDEALERAASVEQQAFTLVYCAHHWHTCDWPQWRSAKEGGWLFNGRIG